MLTSEEIKKRAQDTYESSAFHREDPRSDTFVMAIERELTKLQVTTSGQASILLQLYNELVKPENGKDMWHKDPQLSPNKFSFLSSSSKLPSRVVGVLQKNLSFLEEKLKSDLMKEGTFHRAKNNLYVLHVADHLINAFIRNESKVINDSSIPEKSKQIALLKEDCEALRVKSKEYIRVDASTGQRGFKFLQLSLGFLEYWLSAIKSKYSKQIAEPPLRAEVKEGGVEVELVDRRSAAVVKA